MKTKTWHFCSNGEKWRPYEAFLCSLCKVCDDHTDIEFPEDVNPNKSRSCTQREKRIKGVSKQVVGRSLKNNRNAARRTKFYDGLICVICEKPIEADINFHHIDPSQKEYVVSDMIHRNYSDEKIQKEIDKCVPMHKACHLLVEALLNAPEVSEYVEAARNWIISNGQ